MSKLAKKIDNKDILLITIVVLMILVNLIVLAKQVMNSRGEQTKPNQPTVTSENTTQTTEKITYTSPKEDVIKYLSTIGEASRIKYYCGEYIKLLKHKKYEKAYDLLYDEFKQNYFPTYQSFEKYVKSFYPAMFAVQYDDITRQGDLYVLRLKIIDANNSKQGEEVVQRFVIRENDYDDFVLSFQVKQ